MPHAQDLTDLQLVDFILEFLSLCSSCTLQGHISYGTITFRKVVGD
jgi:hypothetical protein